MPTASSGFPPDQRQRILQETFVECLEFAPSMESTNDRALAMISAGLPRTPLLVLTERQTGGRGRGSNQWWAARGALTCSLIIDPEMFALPAERRPQMSLTLGLAVCRAIARFAPAADVGLKWPNDVLIGDRKTCGILCEVPGRIADAANISTSWMVLGIGLNVNNRSTTAPQELQSRAIALIDVSPHPLSISEVVIELLRQIERNVHLLATNPEYLMDCWREFDVLRQRRVRLRTNSGDICGTARGIDVDGALLLDTVDGLQRCIAGTVVSSD